MRLLLVGKSAFNEDLVKAELRDLGYAAQIHSINDLDEAIVVFDWAIFDVVTVYVDQDDDGVGDLLERTSRKFLQVPVVLILPQKRTQLKRLAKRLGFLKTLTKNTITPSKMATTLITTMSDFRSGGAVPSVEHVNFQEAVDRHYEYVCRFLPDSTITFVNKPFALQLSQPMNKLLGAKLTDSMDQGEQSELLEHLSGLSFAVPSFRFERLSLSGNRRRWVSWHLLGMFDSKGRLTEVQATGTDVTDTVLDQASLNNRSRYQSAITRLGHRTLLATTLAEVQEEGAAVVSEALTIERSSVLIENQAGNYVTCAATGIPFGRIGREIDPRSNHEIRSLISQTEKPVVVSDWQEEDRIENSYVVGRGIHSSVICPIKGSDNKVMGILCAHSRSLDYFGQDKVDFVAAIANILGDAIQRDVAQSRLSDEKERFRITLNSIGDGVISTDALGRVQYINPVAEDLTGWALEDAVGKRIHEVFRIVDEHNRSEVESPVAKCLRQNKASDSRSNSLLISRNGSEYIVEDSVAPIAENDDQVVGVVLVFRNVSEAHRLTKKISHQASHDSLTGLVNRRAFERRLRATLRGSKNDERPHSLCFLNLDQFKIVNEACGHAAGDTVLRQIAHLFKRKIRATDTLARIGGDEFAILMEDCSVVSAQRVARELCAEIEDYRFQFGAKSFAFGVSIGVITLGGSLNSVSSVLQAAEKACSVAKEGGRNRVHVLSSSSDDLERWYGEIEWVARIQDALDNDRFRIFAQVIEPAQAYNRDETPLHIELLIRLEGEDGAIVSPGAFLPAAERYHLAPRLDRWMIQHAFNWMVDHFDELENLGMCSINLSGQTICDEGFERFLVELFELTGVPESKICFEITETAAISNLSEATDFIYTLKKRGVRFALDDFGSGVSSFGYLKALPVDYLKIDGMFVKDIHNSPIDLAMVRSINEIGQLMGKVTIAEYVENDEILEQLRRLGVDMVQGYGIGKPQPIDKLWSPESKFEGTDEDQAVDRSEGVALDGLDSPSELVEEFVDNDGGTMKLSHIVFLS